MIFGQDRAELRKMYADAWQKHTANLPMSALETQIAAVVAEHPEYHEVVSENPDTDYSVESAQTNPYLHMGLHLGVREQVATNRPAGIRRVFEELAARSGDAHTAEHRMIDCLAEALWEAQRAQRPPDEQRYLENLRQL